jgi:hypothetical protein
MRVLDGDQFLVRIFLGESEHRQRRHFAAGTVFFAISPFCSMGPSHANGSVWKSGYF